MAWKKEYAERRAARAASDPAYAAKRREQARSRTPEENRAYMREYYRANKHKWKNRSPEKQAAHNAARRAKYAEDDAHREQKKLEARDWSRKNPEKRKQHRLSKAFGIDLSDFREMLAIQGGRCAICGYSDMSRPLFFPVVDHCHTTGAIRGLLCMNCNQGIGKFKEDASRLFSAIAYLQRHS